MERVIYNAPITMTNQNTPDPRPSLYDLTRPQLEKALAEMGEPTFRAKQIWGWLYVRFAAEIDDMSDLSKSLREKLKEKFVLRRLTPKAQQESTDGWTRKWLFELPDGAEIETVVMEYEGERRTACISSQAGCAMDCSFCATGQMGFMRNLRAGEIVEQVVFVSRVLAQSKESLTNIVYMGMGEPFANFNNVMESVTRLTDPDGLNIGQRKITISTVGLVPGMAKFAAADTQVNLAVSLHAATDELRSRLVPINKSFALKDVAKAIREYITKTNRRVSLEWALIDGVNDTEAQALALVEFIRQSYDPAEEGRNMIHVNMIPLNPTGGFRGRAAHRVQAHKFSEFLTAEGIPNTIRARRGIDIAAGCGQLKAETN